MTSIVINIEFAFTVRELGLITGLSKVLMVVEVEEEDGVDDDDDIEELEVDVEIDEELDTDELEIDEEVDADVLVVPLGAVEVPQPDSTIRKSKNKPKVETNVTFLI